MEYVILVLTAFLGAALPSTPRRLDAESVSGGKVAWQLNRLTGPVLAICLTQ